MGVTHIVMFEFKATADAEAVNNVCASMVGLKDACVHPTLQKPYIKSLTGGKDNSPEGLQRGISHVFVVEFENAEDRDYYVKEDPVHLEFVKKAGEVIERASVVDFSGGVF